IYAEANAPTEEDQKAAHRQEFFSQIPFSEEARANAHMAIEEAYYTLGNIYNFNLEEPQNAKETFITLLDKYPDTSHEPEVLYLLYIISNNLQPQEGDPYKEKLLSEFPNSTYAKTIRNPNYKQESEALSAELQKLYATAFSAYKSGTYELADSLLSHALRSEVLYLLYIISNNLQPQEGDPYKEKLLSEFPNSTYAKTIRNPNYKQESEALSAELQKLYATAFSAYKSGTYELADSLLSHAL